MGEAQNGQMAACSSGSNSTLAPHPSQWATLVVSIGAEAAPSRRAASKSCSSTAARRSAAPASGVGVSVPQKAQRSTRSPGR
jgi:hypothetical protein